MGWACCAGSVRLGSPAAAVFRPQDAAVRSTSGLVPDFNLKPLVRLAVLDRRPVDHSSSRKAAEVDGERQPAGGARGADHPGSRAAEPAPAPCNGSGSPSCRRGEPHRWTPQGPSTRQARTPEPARSPHGLRSGHDRRTGPLGPRPAGTPKPASPASSTVPPRARPLGRASQVPATVGERHLGCGPLLAPRTSAGFESATRPLVHDVPAVAGPCCRFRVRRHPDRR